MMLRNRKRMTSVLIPLLLLLAMALPSVLAAGAGNPSVRQDVLHILKAEDDSEYKMCKAESSSAVLSEDGQTIQLVLTVSSPSYDKLYFGDAADEDKSGSIQATATQSGGWTFVFSVPASQSGEKLPVVPGKPDGSWYTSKPLYILIPVFDSEAEEPGTPAEPEEPSQPENPEEGQQPAPEEKPQGSLVLADGIYSANVSTNSDMFKVVACEITSQKGVMTALITLSGKGYDYLYLGTPAEAYAASESAWIPFETNEEGQYTYRLPLAAVDGTISLSSRSARYASQGKGEEAWLAREMTIDTSSVTKTANLPAQEETEHGIEDGIYSVSCSSSAEMFKVIACKLTVDHGSMTAVVTLSGKGYDYLYMGSPAEAFAASEAEWIPSVPDEEGLLTYQIPVSALDEPLAVASRSARYASQGKGEEAWYARTLTLDSGSMVKIGDLPPEKTEEGGTENPGSSGGTDKPGNTETPEGGETGEKPGENTNPGAGNGTDKPSGSDNKNPSSNGSGTNVGTQDKNEIEKIQQNTKKGTVEDGTYVPSFGFTGGTGRVTISCPQVVVSGGKAAATLVFSSTKYTRVIVNGVEYTNENSGGFSTFTIPVKLNTTTNISAETTAMSTAHVVDYVLYIYVDGSDVSDITPSSSSQDEDKKDDKKEEDKKETAAGDKLTGEAPETNSWGAFDSVQTTAAGEETAEAAAAPEAGFGGEEAAQEVSQPSKGLPVGAIAAIVLVALAAIGAGAGLLMIKKKGK